MLHRLPATVAAPYELGTCWHSDIHVLITKYETVCAVYWSTGCQHRLAAPDELAGSLGIAMFMSSSPIQDFFVVGNAQQAASTDLQPTMYLGCFGMTMCIPVHSSLTLDFMCCVMLHRLPAQVSAPHERSGLSPVQYSRWLDQHSEGELLKSVASALEGAQSWVNQQQQGGAGGGAGITAGQVGVLQLMKQLCQT